CPAEYVEQFEDFAKPIGPAAHDTLENKPSHQKEWAGRVGRDPEQESYRNPLYFGCNSFVDDEIGRILNAIDRLAPENTYVIYTSDHGSMQGAHRLDSKGPVMYEEITHIPLIIRCPEAEDEHVIRSPVSHLDLLPTMLDIAGEEIPPLLQGKSLLPELHGQKSETTAAERNIMIEFTRYAINHDGWGGYQPVRSLVKGKYKLVLNLLHTDELYDLEKDPDELENLIDDPGSEDLRRRLHEELLAEMDRLRDPFRGPCWERRPWCDTRNKKWQGPRRPRPCSLFEPVSYDYGTGRPHDG
ncbi:MAG: sulfatase-like hydrolase/transferase, partial [Planctomycetes bacterium]|nr:sulfatase-like hydrolase/transferase [Planctomycetota bacterium]